MKKNLYLILYLIEHLGKRNFYVLNLLTIKLLLIIKGYTVYYNILNSDVNLNFLNVFSKRNAMQITL